MKQELVYVVDDDEAVRDGLKQLLKSIKIKTSLFPDAKSFIKGYESDPKPGCLLLDIRMPGMSGLELQREITIRKWDIPIIFITGHGDVPMAVEAIQAGASAFIEKPFRDQELIDRIREAQVKRLKAKAEHDQYRSILVRLQSLTQREREIAERVAGGQANKVIALDLELSIRTVEHYRACVMEKMQVRSLPELVRDMYIAGAL